MAARNAGGETPDREQYVTRCGYVAAVTVFPRGRDFSTVQRRVMVAPAVGERPRIPVGPVGQRDGQLAHGNDAFGGLLGAQVFGREPGSGFDIVVDKQAVSARRCRDAAVARRGLAGVFLPEVTQLKRCIELAQHGHRAVG